MKTQTVLLVAFSIALSLGYSEAWAQPSTFQKTFGTPVNESGANIIQTADGGYAMIGTITGNGQDMLFIKTDPLGTTQWSKRYGGGLNDYGNSLQQTADGGYVLLARTLSFGAGDDDVLVIKIDGSGNVLWSKTIGGSGNEQPRIARITKTGNILIAGTTNSAGAGGTDIMLLVLDTSGNILLQKAYGGANGELPYQVDFTPDGGLVIVGFRHNYVTQREVLLMKGDASGNVQWAKVYRDGNWNIGQGVDEMLNFSQRVAGAVEYYISGYTTSYGAGNEDVFVLKADSAGNIIWSNTYGGTGSDFSRGAVVRGSTLFVPGFTTSFGSGGGDIYLLTLDLNGNLLGSRTYGGAASDMVVTEATDNMLQFTGDGGMVLLSSTQSFGAGGSDVYLVKTGIDGSSGCNESDTTATVVGVVPFNTFSITPTVTNLNLTVGVPALSLNSITLFDSVLCSCSVIADAGGDKTIFAGQTIQIGSMPLSGYTYSWSPALGLSNPTVANPYAFLGHTTQYILTVIDFSGCIGRDTVIINVEPSGCGYNTLLQGAIDRDSSVKDVILKNEEILQQYIEENLQGLSGGSHGSGYIIPVVVHIVSDVASDPSSDVHPDRVDAQIASLNRAFSNGNGSTNAYAHDPEITFCLAQNLPDLSNDWTPYNPTGKAGVTYIDDPTLSTIDINNFQQIEALISATGFPPNRYLNIWVVSNITPAGVLGFITLPASPNNPNDGIVILNDVFGDLLTCSSPQCTTLTTNYDWGMTGVHEAGHYFDLYHTFQRGEFNNEPACLNSTCNQNGDKCCDTPPVNNTGNPDGANFICDETLNSCSTDSDDPSPGNPYSNPPFNAPDMVRNYMDYTDDHCKREFTLDQVNRMLGNIATRRANLVSVNNLGLTGLTGTACAPQALVAGFVIDNLQPCINETITFTTVTSGNTATSWNWDFGDGNTANGPGPHQHSYTLPGTYTVQLEVSDGTDTEIFTQTIFVGPLADIFTGTPVVCAGSATDIIITFTGTPSFSGILSDNINNYPFFTTTNVAVVNVIVDPANPVFTITSLSDANCGPVAGPSITITPLNCCGPNLVLNGDFENGNVDFNSDHNYIACPPIPPCTSGCGTFVPGDYAIYCDPSLINGNWSGTNHTAGGSQFLICDVNGTCTSPPCPAIWNQQINGMALDRSYTFACYINNLIPEGANPAWVDPILRIEVNGTPVISQLTIPRAPTDTWWPISAVIPCSLISASNGTANISISTENYGGTGNDIAIDDISLFASCSVLTAAISTDANVTCNSGSDGEVTASGSGGTTPYTFEWSNGLSTIGTTTLAATGLSAGSYTVTLTDNAGCTATESVTMTEPDGITVTITNQVNVSCNGGNNGSATISASGGTGTLSYNWSTSPNQTTVTATGLSAQTYTVTVTDANNCTTASNINISEPSVISVSTSGTNVKCNGGSDGIATATASGGTGTLSYTWSTTPSQSTTTATGLSAQVYTVTVTDGNNCTTTQTATITQPSAISIVITKDNISCNGLSDGQATATPSGGTSGYNFLWSDVQNQTTQSATGLFPGNYSVTVTDANSCTQTASVTITQPVVFTVSTSAMPSCANPCNGSVTITSGTSTALPYNYLWSNGATTISATALCQGFYAVTVTDNNGCTTINSGNISQYTPDVVWFYTPVISVSCNGICDGNAGIFLTTNYSPLVYSWSTGSTISTAGGQLCPGNYSVTVTNSKGCITTRTSTITEPPPLTVTTTSTPACVGMYNGSATANPSGGTPGYNYQWDTPYNSGSQTAQSQAAGTYNVTVTDANGCAITGSATIENLLLLSITSTDVCGGTSYGAAEVAATNCWSPLYYYSWSPGLQTTSTITGLGTGTYDVTVTDYYGTTGTASVTISDITTYDYSAGIPVSSSQTWNGYDWKVKGGIWIAPGVTLTISNSTIHFSEIGYNHPDYGEWGIVVDVGATLILNNCTLTSIASCPSMWDGIFVTGVGFDYPQPPITDNGFVIFNGYSDNVLENSHTGVQSGMTNPPSWPDPYSGGVIQVFPGNKFINNDKHIVVIHYPWRTPSNLVFDGSDFICDGPLPDINKYNGKGTSYFLSFGGNHTKITVRGCTFRNRGQFPIAQRGTGIWNSLSHLVVDGNCFDCIGSSKFIGLTKGIHDVEPDWVELTVKGNQFDNNLYGMLMEGSMLSTITDNHFNISREGETIGTPPDPVIIVSYQHFGIYAASATGYRIESNTFNHYTGANANGYNYGILTRNSWPYGGKIYRNNFGALNVGNQMQYNNSLAFSVDCNTYTNEQYDWAVTSGTITSPQGNCVTGNPEAPAANQFSAVNCAFFSRQIHKNAIATPFTYNSYDDLMPICVSNGVSVPISCYPGPVTSDACPITQSPGCNPCEMATISGATSQIATLKNNIDGGSTQARLQTISTKPAGQIKDELLLYSPYLSDTVLLAYLAKPKTGPGNVPPGHVKEVIIANSPVTAKVKTAVDNRGLPNGIQNQINSAQTGISARQLLEEQITSLETEKQLAVNRLVTNYIDSGYVDSAVLFLEAQNTVNAKMALVTITLSRDSVKAAENIAAIRTIADSIAFINPSSADVEDLRTYADFYELLLGFYSRPAGIFSLNSAEEQEIRTLAAGNTPVAVNAQTILRIVFDEDFERLAEPIDNPPSAKTGNFETEEEEYDKEINSINFDKVVKIYPNPANDYLTIEFKLPGAVEYIRFALWNILGQEAVRLKINAEKRRQQIDIKRLPEGLYYYEITVNNNSYKRDKLVIIRK